MRVEIIADAYRHCIDSRNLSLIGEWFSEKAALFMSANTQVCHPIRVDIWPEYSEEIELVGNAQRTMKFTQDDLLDFAKHLLDVSAKLGELE